MFPFMGSLRCFGGGGGGGGLMRHYSDNSYKMVLFTYSLSKANALLLI